MFDIFSAKAVFAAFALLLIGLGASAFLGHNPPEGAFYALRAVSPLLLAITLIAVAVKTDPFRPAHY